MYWIVGIIITIFVIWLIIKALYRSHIKWLSEQSPVGVWVCDESGCKMTLQFNGEESKTSGTFYKLLEYEEKTEHVFGSWVSILEELKMLAMASESVKYPIGTDLIKKVVYAGPESIWIEHNEQTLKFNKAPKDVNLDFETMKIMNEASKTAKQEDEKKI